jgi:hypothetical protein
VLKQRVRDRIDPKKDLGHSDVGGKKKDAVKDKETEVESVKTSQEGSKEETKEESKEEQTTRILEQGMAQVKIDDTSDVKRNPDGTICEDCR